MNEKEKKDPAKAGSFYLYDRKTTDYSVCFGLLMHFLLFKITKNLKISQPAQFGVPALFFALCQNTPNFFVVQIGINFLDNGLIVGNCDVFYVYDEVAAFLHGITVELETVQGYRRGAAGIQGIPS